MRGRILELMKTEPTKYWSVTEIRDKIKGYTRRQTANLGTNLHGMCWAGKLARRNDVGINGGFGYRLLPDDWPSVAALQGEIVALMSDLKPRDAAEISAEITRVHLKHPCSTVLVKLVVAMVEDGILEIAMQQRKYSTYGGPSIADLKLAYRYWLMYVAGTPA